MPGCKTFRTRLTLTLTSFRSPWSWSCVSLTVGIWSSRRLPHPLRRPRKISRTTNAPSRFARVSGRDQKTMRMIEARGKPEGINMGSVGIFILWLEANYQKTQKQPPWWQHSPIKSHILWVRPLATTGGFHVWYSNMAAGGNKLCTFAKTIGTI